MLCQNCKKNEANMHMKRIINGRAEEVHLCSDCARSLGYSGSFADFGGVFGEMLGDVFGRGDTSLPAVKCPFCGKSFDEIVEDGKVGCAECYEAFYDKLLPSLKRIHGSTRHVGKAPNAAKLGKEELLETLKIQLAKAIEQQDFEKAATLRDKLIALTEEGKR